MMRGLCHLLAAAALLMLMAPAAAAQTEISLRDLVALAIKRNPTLEASGYSVEALKAKITQSQSGWYPQLSLSTQSNRVSSEPSVAYATGYLYNEYLNKFTVSQLITDFGQTQGGIKQSRRNLAVGRAGHAATLADLVRDVRKAYYDVLVKQRLIEVNEQALNIKLEYARKAQAFVKAGLKAKIYATKAKVDVANARLALVKARFDLRNSLASLEKILGGPPASGPYRLAAAGALPPPPSGLDGLKAAAEKNRPEVIKAAEQVEATRALLNTYQATYWPTLNATGVWGWDDYEFPLAQIWQLQLALSWDLFTGMKRDGQVSEARATLLQNKAQLREAKFLVHEEVTQSYNDCIRYHESINASRQSLVEAQENLEAAQARFATGAASAIELSDAIELLINAKSNLAQAVSDYFSSLAQLDRALGRLPSQLMPPKQAKARP